MKRIMLFLMVLTVLALSILPARALADDGVVGKTLKVKGSDCVVTFNQGPFGCGEGCQAGTALLTCGGIVVMDLFFAYQYPLLVIYSNDPMVIINYALVGNTFKPIDPDGVELLE